jgi:putative YphP/YqiW family bacilliredoxin
LLRDGELVYMMQRSDIEHREAVDIAGELKGAFDRFCAKAGLPT